eukprot:11896670-Alexandrium_andersonii.AAC.1
MGKYNALHTVAEGFQYGIIYDALAERKKLVRSRLHPCQISGLFPIRGDAAPAALPKASTSRCTLVAVNMQYGIIYGRALRT